jgi:hypothetical protein
LHNSGHNSYLEGNQLTSKAGTQTIEIGLKSGCRVIELDVYDGPNGQPICTHGGTLTSNGTSLSQQQKHSQPHKQPAMHIHSLFDVLEVS